MFEYACGVASWNSAAQQPVPVSHSSF